MFVGKTYLWLLVVALALSTNFYASGGENVPAKMLINTWESNLIKSKHLVVITDSKVLAQIHASLEKKPVKCKVYLWSVYPIAFTDKKGRLLSAYWYYPVAKPDSVFVKAKAIQEGDSIRLIEPSLLNNGIVFSTFEDLIKDRVTLK